MHLSNKLHAAGDGKSLYPSSSCSNQGSAINKMQYQLNEYNKWIELTKLIKLIN